MNGHFPEQEAGSSSSRSLAQDSNASNVYAPYARTSSASLQNGINSVNSLFELLQNTFYSSSYEHDTLTHEVSITPRSGYERRLLRTLCDEIGLMNSTSPISGRADFLIVVRWPEVIENLAPTQVLKQAPTPRPETEDDIPIIDTRMVSRQRLEAIQRHDSCLVRLPPYWPIMQRYLQRLSRSVLEQQWQPLYLPLVTHCLLCPGAFSS